MKLTKLMLVCVTVLLAALSASAQEEKSTVTALEFQTPKNGMTQQYEAGRKAKAAWHKQQKDPEMLFVLQVLTGEHTGSYIVGRGGVHWADFDKPAVSDAADEEEYNKVVGAYVEKRTASYFESLPKVSNPGPQGAKYTSVTSFHIRYGKGDDFRSAIARMYDAAQKTKWPFHYHWERLANGGPGGEYVLLVDHANWASFEDDPAIKPLRDVLREAFGEQEAMSVIERLNGSIESTYSEIVEFRGDLSYIAEK
ncbi:MAG: hypothetical protein WAU58_13535 [Terriglobales bacterium]